MWLYCWVQARQTLSSWHLTSIHDRETGLSAWCRIFYSFHLLTHDTRGARFSFSFTDVTLQKTFVDACDMCVVHPTFTVVLQTRDGIVTNLFGLHTWGMWPKDWQGAMSACISWAHLLFPLSLTLSLASLNYSAISPITRQCSCPTLTYTICFVTRPAIDMDHDLSVLKPAQTCMFTEKIAGLTA